LIRESKSLIDEICSVLVQKRVYPAVGGRLTYEEPDFIINYDIKYRMGRDAGEEE
jgi:hypothetical protein